ncbi:MAG: 4Fe-4S dicluster domain-containing protein [Planctomycetota bacterium]
MTRIDSATAPSSIDSALTGYDFDEEAGGFGEPPHVPDETRRSALEWLGLALAGLGATFFVLSATTGVLRGTWGGFLGSFGLLVAGAFVFFADRYRGTQPGIRNDNTYFSGAKNRGALGWALGIGFTGFYLVLYFYESYWRTWGMPRLLDGPIRLVDPLALLLTGHAADRWFLYGTLYTLLILVFGVRMFWRYRHNRYQLLRTASVMFFQLAFAFLIPNLLKLFQQPEFYFSYFWPLKPEYLFPTELAALTEASRLGVFMAFWGVVLGLVGVPILTYFHGKRWYCSWVCGCGGLAETLGDPWRHQSIKSTSAWKLERWLIHSVLVLIVVTTGCLWINSATEGRLLGRASQTFASFYGLWIGAVFSGVIGVGFYPLLGNRVWCRFGCPQAAILGLFQRFASRFRITTNGSQCMSCGNCSTYCEMGIDVRAYAQRGENIVRASCVGCGVCSAVCPRGVLKLENGKEIGDRYPGASQPVQAFLHAVTTPPEQGRNC